MRKEPIMNMKNVMNKSLLASSVFTVLFSLNAVAADGTINFTGNVTSSACTTIVGAGPTGGAMSNPATVALPNVTDTTLNAAVGTYAGHTPFSISLTGCEATAALQNVRAIFTTPSPASGDNFVMGNTAVSGAQNVAVAILSSGGSQIDLNGGPNVDAGQALPVTSGPVTLNYQAAYKSLTTGVTAGAVAGTAEYIISYF